MAGIQHQTCLLAHASKSLLRKLRVAAPVTLNMVRNFTRYRRRSEKWFVCMAGDCSYSLARTLPPLCGAFLLGISSLELESMYRAVLRLGATDSSSKCSCRLAVALQISGLQHRGHGPRQHRRPPRRHTRPSRRGAPGRQTRKLRRFHGVRDGAQRGRESRPPFDSKSELAGRANAIHTQNRVAGGLLSR